MSRAERWFQEKIQDLWNIKLELGKIEDVVKELPNLNELRDNGHVPIPEMIEEVENIANEQDLVLFFTANEIVHGKMLKEWKKVVKEVEKLDKDFEYLNEKLQEKGLML